MVRSKGRFVGDSTAPQVVLEFGDFQCPYCAKEAEVLRAFAEKHPRGLAVEFHHKLINSHALARPAALASECAAEQGRFTAFYYTVYANQTRLRKWSWNEFAKRSGVTDLARFDECIKSERYAQRVAADLELAERFEIAGTPSWVFRDSVFAGTASLAQLERWLKATSADSIKTPVSGR
jgi:protein-disulfide isomerase